MAGKDKSKVLTESGNPLMDVFRGGLFQALGTDVAGLKRQPLIAIANSHSEFTAGHTHLRTLGEKVKEGVLMAGGQVVEFNVPAPCDGMAMGHDGMRYVLAQRDLIADIVETHVRSQRFDGLVLIASCDKINPAMMMAAARLDLPAIYLAGGPNLYDVRHRSDFKGSIEPDDYESRDTRVATVQCGTCGACEIMGTANTFQCLAEAMGICIPGSSNVPAYHSDKLKYARLTGQRIVAMVNEGLTFRRVLTRPAILNAVAMNMAIGGSTNATLHLPAIAHSAGFELPLSVFDEYSRKIPTLLAVAPNGPWGLTDVWAAGGMPAVLKMMQQDLDLTCLTVMGTPLANVVEQARVTNSKVIPPRDKPFRADGGLAILKGNLAPEGSVIKQAGVKPELLRFEGPAVCFDSEESAIEGIKSGAVKHGDVVVMRYLGPRGAPGMPEMLGVTSMLKAFRISAALVTDGRFSGGTSGPCVGHITPEASAGGPIAAVMNGDRVLIDVSQRQLHLDVPAETLASRLAAVTPVEKETPTGFLQRYRKYVSSAARGAILE
ncbi:dihydroxy-acid dehydratase [Steroidobacter cummioxidans]|uniref:dihydroxy-acid dehydratase n=1 Tax=Steroidobacter cummioxidans TaxID=1803913 RepID=UPI0019D4447E|nr:dihydroxy-acid dehydratase [Steroidobacter cummioxidans]